MHRPVSSPLPRPRPFAWAIGLLALGLTAVANATVGPGTIAVNPPTGGFAIDGNLQANVPASGIGDWVPGPPGGGGAVLAAGGAPLNVGTTYHLTDPYSSGTDDNFNGGLKFDDNPNIWTWVANPVSNKTDINNGFLHFTTDAAGHTWLLVAADRLSNKGDAYIDFEFLQNSLTVKGTPGVGGGFSSTGPNGGRTLNDFLLTLSLTQGGTTSGFAVQRWESVGGGLFDYMDRTAMVPMGAVFAAVNTATVPVSFGAFGSPSYPTNTFVEGAIDLTAMLAAFDPCLSLGIRTIFIKTKTSQSPTATITDFITPLAVSRHLGVLDAGLDQSACSQGSSTTFTLAGSAVPAPSDVVTSTIWSVASGSATIDAPGSLTTGVHVTSPSATLRLTVTTTPHGCIANDDVLLEVKPLPPCAVTGPEGPLCPNSGLHRYCAPAGAASYQWTIAGDGSIVGSSTGQCVDVQTALACNGSFTLTLAVQGENGCSRTCDRTVPVVDATAPAFSGVGADRTIACDQMPTFSEPSATDACDPSPTLSFEDVTMPGSCPQNRDVTRTWTATDRCGNSSTANQTIHLVDTTAPVIAGVGNEQTLSCDRTPPFSEPTATDACDPNPSLTYVDVTTPGSCPQTQDVTRTWTATDHCGNSSTASQTVHLVDTTAPVIAGVGDEQTIACDRTPPFSEPTATDACDPSPTLAFEDVTTSGSCPQAYSVTRTWTASDHCGNASTASQVIHLVDTTAPAISPLPEPTTIECPAGPSFMTPSATDACDPDPTLTFEDVTTPGDCPQAYSVTRTWTATDHCRNSSTANQVIHVVDTTAPTISALPGPTTIECPAGPVFATPTAIDDCDPIPALTFEDVATLGSCPHARDVTRTWTATDHCGNTATASQVIHVVDTTPPVITALPEPTTIECPETPSFATPTASDDCDLDPTLTFVDATTPGGCPQEYSVTRTWTATDHCGNSSRTSQTVNVVDSTAPSLSALPEPTTIECSATPQFTTPTATDACDPNPTLTFKDVTTPGSCPQAKDVTRTWTGTDHCGNSSTMRQVIHVVDTTAPSISALPGPTTIQCPASPVFTTPTATDACDPNTTLRFEDVTTPGDCPQARDVTRTWTATDHCGNSSTASQLIHVVDTTPPVVTCPGDITVPGCQSVVTWESSAVDACAGPLQVTCDPPSGTTFPLGETIVTCTATDACGNVGRGTFKVTIPAEGACSITGGEQPICEGQTATLCGPEGKLAYVWTGPNLQSSERCITVGTAGVYELTVTDPETGCRRQCSRELVVRPIPVCTIGGVTAIADGGKTLLCGPSGSYAYEWSTGATSQCIIVSEPGTYGLVVRDAVAPCASASCSVTITRLQCACSLGYPDSTNLPRSAVLFNESEVLRTFEPGSHQCVSPGGTIKLWYNDEHAMTLGVRRVIVKTSSGTTTTDYPISPTPAGAAWVDHPLVGTTAVSGDACGNDIAAGGGRPLWPVLFLTDLTVHGYSSRNGDWQQGGTGVPPHRVCGTWKAAVRTVDKTVFPAKVTVTPDPDPAKNHWNLPGGDTPPGGFGGFVDEGYGAECVWSVNELGLIPGHTYRAQFIVHDGDQNKVGGDCGEACTTVQYLPAADAPEAAPRQFLLLQNTPNPFWESTTIRYSLPERSDVRLSIVDIAGRLVATLVSGTRAAGDCSVEWRGTDQSGMPVSAGMYFYRLEVTAGGHRQLSRQMILVR